MKPQIGYAELVQVILGVTVPKGQTRTDWSRRPLSAAQLHYAAEDVLHLGEIAAHLSRRLTEARARGLGARGLPRIVRSVAVRRRPDARLGARARTHPDAAASAAAGPGAAAWREREARERDLPRAWILSDTAILETALANPPDAGGLRRLLRLPDEFPQALAAGAVAVLRDASQQDPADMEPAKDARPTPEQKSLAERLARRVDARAAELGVSAEVLAPRGELKALAQGARSTSCLQGCAAT